MIIAVNTGPLYHYPGRQRRFIYDMLKQLAANNPKHIFLLLDAAAPPWLVESGANISVLAAGPATENRLLQKIWLNVKLPLLLKKNKVDVFVTFDNCCSMTTPAPQCIILLKNEKANKGFLKKAKRIAFFSKGLQQKMEREQKIPAGKTDIITAAANENFKPFISTEKEKIKERFSNGREFFLVNEPVNTNDEFIYLLKAFSHFKKRQQSSMQLLLFIQPGSSLTDGFATYKYRNDVKFIDETDEDSPALLTASAYAVVCPVAKDGTYLSVLEAMQCSVPVISAADDGLKEIAATAVLYVDDETAKSLGEKMMQIYTNETLREQFAERGKQIAAQNTLQKAAGLLWQSIMKTVN